MNESSEATLLYTGQFDGSQIMESLDKTDAGFVKLDATAKKAFTGVSSSSQTAQQGIKNVSDAQKEAAASAENLGFKEQWPL